MSTPKFPLITFHSIENYKYPTEDHEIIRKVLNSKIPCKCCNSTLLFFDFIRKRELGARVWASVWYCEKTGCKDHRVFQFS